jgi:hypothetical protein
MGDTEADRIIRQRAAAEKAREEAEARALEDRRRRSREYWRSVHEQRDGEAAALIPRLLELLKQRNYLDMEEVLLQHPHSVKTRFGHKMLPAVTKAGLRLADHAVVTPGGTIEGITHESSTETYPVYLLSDGRVVVLPVACKYLSTPALREYAGRGTKLPYTPLEDATDAYYVPRLRDYLDEFQDKIARYERPPA